MLSKYSVCILRVHNPPLPVLVFDGIHSPVASLWPVTPSMPPPSPSMASVTTHRPRGAPSPAASHPARPTGGFNGNHSTPSLGKFHSGLEKGSKNRLELTSMTGGVTKGGQRGQRLFPTEPFDTIVSVSKLRDFWRKVSYRYRISIEICE